MLLVLFRPMVIAIQYGGGSLASKYFFRVGFCKTLSIKDCKFFLLPNKSSPDMYFMQLETDVNNTSGQVIWNKNKVALTRSQGLSLNLHLAAVNKKSPVFLDDRIQLVQISIHLGENLLLLCLFGLFNCLIVINTETQAKSCLLFF